MNILIPTDGIIELGATSGLLSIIDKMGAALNTAINTSEVKLHVLGLSYPRINDEGNIYPVVPNEALTDEISLLPCDLWPGYAFFDYSESQKVITGGAVGNPRIKTTLNLICFVNFKRMASMVKWTGDYRLYKENFKTQILTVISKNFAGLGGNIALTEIIDNRIDDVFAGYKLSIENLQFYQQPYYAVRFVLEINHMVKIC